MIAFRLFSIFILTFVFLFFLGYLDFDIISPQFLAEDYCYYHNHDTPWWVDTFYLDVSGHPESMQNPLHLLLLFALSFFLSIYTTLKLEFLIFKKKLRITVRIVDLKEKNNLID